MAAPVCQFRGSPFLSEREKWLKWLGKACWGFGLGQRWWRDVDKMNRIQMPELSLNALLFLSLLLSTWSPLCARSGREGVNEAAAAVVLIAWMNKWLLEDSVNTGATATQIIVKISDISQISNTFQKYGGLPSSSAQLLLLGPSRLGWIYLITALWVWNVLFCHCTL